MSVVKQISVCTGKDSNEMPIWSTKDIGVNLNNVNVLNSSKDTGEITYTDSDFLVYIDSNNNIKVSTITLKQIQDLLNLVEQQSEPEL